MADPELRRRRRVFIFGFSRGAYTARSLSGLISKCGILKLGAPLSIEQLYARYRLYVAPTIGSLLGKPLPQDASLEERWLTKYSRPTKIKFVGVWDTVGSMGIPHGSAEAKVHKYRFLDTHLRLDNEYAFHALALDEHREDFEATFWTRTVKTGEVGAPDRPVGNVEQCWFVGCHANVGGGYASDPLSQRPLVWLMDKAGALGLVYRTRSTSTRHRSRRQQRLIRRVRKGDLSLLLEAVLSLRWSHPGEGDGGDDIAHQ
ncbi:DUF2235 domain-containing protein [Bradyrhizobium elkanii]|nr:DUF2235 domain-containing protein [Bradyrhizobium elkanii]